MTITLSDSSTTLALDPDLRWSDEQSWSSVVQVSRYKLNGALSVHVSERKAGRPITLQGDEKTGWAGMTGAVLAQLREWSETPGQQLTLMLRGTTYTVIFRHQDAPALDATPIEDFRDPLPTDRYVVTLKLMVI